MSTHPMSNLAFTEAIALAAKHPYIVGLDGARKFGYYIKCDNGVLMEAKRHNAKIGGLGVCFDGDRWEWSGDGKAKPRDVREFFSDLLDALKKTPAIKDPSGKNWETLATCRPGDSHKVLK